jgi:hypothetical protein
VAARGSCAVREPLFNHLFNLSSLYNTTADHFINSGGRGMRFVLNVCGPLVSLCNPFDRSTVCLGAEGGEGEEGAEGGGRLSYEDGTLVLSQGSNRKDIRIILTVNFEHILK